MKLLWSILFALSASFRPALSAEHQKISQKHRTLNDLIALALKNGSSETVSIALGKHLGYTNDMPAKTIAYQNKYAENGYQKSFYVVIEKNKSAAKAHSLVWLATIKTVKSDGNYYDTRTFRTDLAGNFIAGVRGVGPGRSVIFTPIKSNKESLALLKKDIDYFLVKAVNYQYIQ